MFKTIVLALDGSENSQRVTPIAAELAKRDSAKLVLVHVDERTVGKGGGDIRAGDEEIREAIRKQAEELSSQGIDASVEVKDVILGGPAHAIAEAAESAGADLIVIGTRGHSSVGGLLLGSVTQRLLHIAKVPVLAVPPS